MSQETTELFWSPQVPLAEAEELWSSLLFSYCSNSPTPTGPQNLQTCGQCDLTSITPSHILFFLGCLVFFFLIFLSSFSQCWNWVELAAQSRRSGCFGIGFSGLLRRTTLYPRDVPLDLSVSCVSSMQHFPIISQKVLYPLLTRNLLSSRTLLIIRCHID